MATVRVVLLILMIGWTLLWLGMGVHGLTTMSAIDRADRLMPGIHVFVTLIPWSIGMLPLWLIRHVTRPRRVPHHTHV